MSSVNWVRHGERQCVSDKEKVEGRVLLGEAWRRNDIEESMSNRCALKEGKNTPSKLLSRRKTIPVSESENLAREGNRANRNEMTLEIIVSWCVELSHPVSRTFVEYLIFSISKTAVYSDGIIFHTTDVCSYD